MGQGGDQASETLRKDLNSDSASVPDKQEKLDSAGLAGPQPLREEQVQNAVKFLSHPKVNGSPIVYRRSFLEQKGLTKEEIDEAFRRVPDSLLETGNNTASVQETQSVSAASSGVPAHLTASQQHSHQNIVSEKNGQPNWSHWTEMILAIGVGAGATVLAKNYLLPKLKGWLRHVLEDDDSATLTAKLDPTREVTSAAAAATAAAVAASDIALVTGNILTRRREDHECLEHIRNAMETHAQELKLTLSTMRESLVSIERSTSMSAGLNNSHHMSDVNSAADFSHESLGSRQQKTELQEAHESLALKQQKTELQELQNKEEPVSILCNSDSDKLVRPSALGDVPSNAPHSASYMQIIAMLERGEKPPNIKDINDKPPNPNQPPSSSKLRPRVKPWELPGHSHPFNLSIPISRAVNTEPIKLESNASKVIHKMPIKVESNTNFEYSYEKSPVVVETVGSLASSDALHYKRMEQAYDDAGTNWPTLSNVRITEEGPQIEASININGKTNSNSSILTLNSPTFSSTVSLGAQGWLSSPEPQTSLPVAASAMRHEKVTVNGHESQLYPTSNPDSLLEQSLRSPECEMALPYPTVDGPKSNAPEVESTGGQESHNVGESNLEKPLDKDVVLE